MNRLDARSAIVVACRMKDIEHLAGGDGTRRVRHAARDERDHPGAEDFHLAADGELQLTGQHRRQLLVRMRMLGQSCVGADGDEIAHATLTPFDHGDDLYLSAFPYAPGGLALAGEERIFVLR